MKTKIFFAFAGLFVASSCFARGTDIPQCNNSKICIETEESPYDVPVQTNFFKIDALQIHNAADLWMTIDDAKSFSVQGPNRALMLILDPNDPSNVLNIGVLRNTVADDQGYAYSELVLNPGILISSSYTKSDLPTDTNDEWCKNGHTVLTVQYVTTVSFSKGGVVQKTLAGTNPVDVSTGSTCTSAGHGGHHAP